MSERTDSLVGGAAVISALTLLSRLLGVVRDCACAAIFGAGMVWDAFSFAFRIPNLFRRLFGEGALSAAFVPVLSEYLELRDREQREHEAQQQRELDLIQENLELAQKHLGDDLEGEVAAIEMISWDYVEFRFKSLQKEDVKQRK